MSKLTIPSEKELANVTAFPDEVLVTVSAYDGSFTTEQAREFAGLLLIAADQSEHLDWDEDADNPHLINRETREPVEVN